VVPVATPHRDAPAGSALSPSAASLGRDHRTPPPSRSGRHTPTYGSLQLHARNAHRCGRFAHRGRRAPIGVIVSRARAIATQRAIDGEQVHDACPHRARLTARTSSADSRRYDGLAQDPPTRTSGQRIDGTTCATLGARFAIEVVR
jgi:hypothetical protein